MAEDRNRKKEDEKKKHRPRYDVYKVKLARNTPRTPYNEAVSWQQVEMSNANQTGFQPGYYHLNQYIHRESTSAAPTGTIQYYQNPVWTPPPPQWVPNFPVAPQPDPNFMFQQFQAPSIPQPDPFGSFQPNTTGNQVYQNPPPEVQTRGPSMYPVNNNPNQSNKYLQPGPSQTQMLPNYQVNQMPPRGMPSQAQMPYGPRYQGPMDQQQALFQQQTKPISPFSMNAIGPAGVNCLTGVRPGGSQLGGPSPRSVLLENKLNNVEQGLQKLNSMIKVLKQQKTSQMAFPDQASQQKMQRMDPELSMFRFNQLVQQFNNLCQGIKQQENQVALGNRENSNLNLDRAQSNMALESGWLEKQTGQLDRLVNEVEQLERDLNAQLLSAIALQ